MASNLYGKFTGLVIGVVALSTAANVTITSIRDSLTSSDPAPLITTGDTYLVTADNAAPAVYLDTETTPVKTWPTSLGTEHCEGNTGALICTINIKLTGSGAHRNNNAGSFVCTTSTCSMLDIQVHMEAVPTLGGDRLYLGWTTSPTTQSGAQFISWALVGSGQTLVGSGSYIHPTNKAVGTVRNGEVPPGATVKATWTKGNGSENYGSYKGIARFVYMKYYNP